MSKTEYAPAETQNPNGRAERRERALSLLPRLVEGMKEAQGRIVSEIRTNYGFTYSPGEELAVERDPMLATLRSLIAECEEVLKP